MILFLDLFGCCKNALEITIHIFIHFFKSNFFHVKRQLYIVFIFSKIWFWSLIALESKQKNYSFFTSQISNSLPGHANPHPKY